MNISIYDKTNNLTDFIEFDNNKELSCYYSVRGRVMHRKFSNNCDKEVVSSTIEYAENIMLHPIPWQPETSYTAIESGGTLGSYGKINIIDRVDTYQDQETKSLSNNLFTVKPDLIKEWSNKL